MSIHSGTQLGFASLRKPVRIRSSFRKSLLGGKALHNFSEANAKFWVVTACWFAHSVEVMNWFENETVRMDSNPACSICPLSRVQAGMTVRVRQLCAGPETKNRLREIGLGEDQIIRLITSQTNFICQVCNARLAISEQLAKLILVEPVLLPARAAQD